MSRARGRSVIARKEQAYLRRHPGTVKGTVKYLAEKRERAYQERRKKLAWIDETVRQFHKEELTT